MGQGVSSGEKQRDSCGLVEGWVQGDLSRLSTVTRFSTAGTVRKESVAEHTYFSSLYSYLVYCWCMSHCPSRMEDVSLANLLVSALVHDIEESYTGDIVRMFKHSSPELKREINRSAERYIETLPAKILPNNEYFSASLRVRWKRAKDTSTIAGRIVSFSDFLSVIQYLLSEMKFSNKSMEDHYTELERYVDTFSSEEYDFIRPLVEECREIVRVKFCVSPKP